MPLAQRMIYHDPRGFVLQIRLVPGSSYEKGLQDEGCTMFAASLCVFEARNAFVELTFTGTIMLCRQTNTLVSSLGPRSCLASVSLTSF